MTGRLAAWSARHHSAVIAGAVLLMVAGVFARRALPRDVLPDLADPQIVLVAEWMGHPAVEVATRVTAVLTGALEGVPGSKAVRGSSMRGMGYVDVVFDRGANLTDAREAIRQRAGKVGARLPEGVHVEIGPVASSTGWIFQYALVDPGRRQSPRELRRFQDDVLRLALLGVAGVAEVAAVGGTTRDVSVEVQPEELRRRGLAFTDVLAGLRTALDWHGPASLGWLETRAIPGAAAETGIPPLQVKDVATVRLGDQAPAGLADFGGAAHSVGGIVIARREVDLPRVIAEVRRVLDRARSWLPEGVQLVTVYDRLELIDRVEDTLLRALAEELAVVVLVVLIFLVHARSAAVTVFTLPMVLLLTFGAMWVVGVPATIMSLGGIAIALGMAVDADLVALEACHRRLERVGAGAAPVEQRRSELLAAAGAFAPAILTSLIIAALTFLPVLAFTGETGRLLRPLALTKTLVILSAAVVAVTVAPAMRDRLLRSGRVVPELDNPLTRTLVRIYRPFVHFALSRPLLTLVTAGLAVVSCLPILGRLGGEFLPRVDEGDLLFMPTTSAGVTAEDAVSQLGRQDRAIAEFAEVATVFGKVGRADTATDPAPFSMVETTIRLLPRSEWPSIARTRWYSRWAPAALKKVLGLVWPEESAPTTSELVESLDRATRLPGWTSAWTAPIRARMDMMSTGIHTPVGVRISAGDLARVDELGAALRAMAGRLPGTRGAILESLGGEVGLDLVADPAAMALHGVDPALVRSTAELLITGGHFGEVELDNRRTRVHVTLGPSAEAREVANQLRAATVRSWGGAASQPVPLALVARLGYVQRAAMVRSEGGQLVGRLYIDLAPETDVLQYVAAGQAELKRTLAGGALRLRPGEKIEWVGQHELFAAGQQRLRWIALVVALSMMGLLFLQFRSLTEALIVLLSVPFALVGSFWILFLLDYRLSAPVWVGLLSVVGLAMQTGVVMVVYIDEAFHRRVREGRLRSREDIVAAHAEGTVLRLRPKIMTITTMAAALLPLLWTEGAGAEIMKRVAAPMIGGLATSAVLTLEVIPVVYTIWRSRQLRRAQRTGQPLAAVVGRVPTWAAR